MWKTEAEMQLCESLMILLNFVLENRGTVVGNFPFYRASPTGCRVFNSTLHNSLLVVIYPNISYHHIR